MKIIKLEIPIAVFGKWEVMGDGTIVGKYCNGSGKDFKIHIYPDRLQEPDLLLEMNSGKIDSGLGDIMQALLTAWKITGIKSIPNFKTDFE